MMRLRRASTIAALSLLASAATAYAECAWVLWAKSHESLNTWQPSGAHLSLRSCQTALDQLPRNQEGGKWVVSPGSAFYSKEDAVYQHVVCLPDTVDPRGPKGK